MIKAECTWGDGPDVLVVVESQGWVETGVDKGSFGLSMRGARELARQLNKAADYAEELNRGWVEARKEPER